MEWYISISAVLKEHGWRRLKSDPCCWILVDPSLVKKKKAHTVMTRSECPVVAATGGHVDDFVFVGKEGNKVCKIARKQLEHPKGGGLLLTKNEFDDELREIQKSPQKREAQSSFTTRTNNSARTCGWTGLEM